jgi:hypothetical protein
MSKTNYKKIVSLVLITALVGVIVGPIQEVQAMSGVSDTMSRLKKSTDANHEFDFTLGGSIDWDAGDTLTLTFASGFDLTDLATDDPDDYDIKTDGSDETIVALGECASTDAIEIHSISSQVITFQACTSYTAPGTGSAIEIQIGTNATHGASGDSQIQNPSSAGSYNITIGGTIGDAGTMAIGIANEDQVSISATVDPYLEFDVTDSTVALGTLSTTAVQTDTAAMTAETNTTSGYSITVSGATLTNGAYTITKIGGTHAASNPGTEQFGMRIAASGGSGAAVDPYDDASEYAYDGDSAADECAQSSGASALTTFTMTYMANIATTTEPGSYTTTHTYICTGTF